MFIIGILSTPLPYFLMAFAYLVGLSMGLFQNNDKNTVHEEYTSNIINYEVLNPSEEITTEDAHFNDFVNVTFTDKDQTANFEEFLISFDHFNTYSPPQEELLQYNYTHSSNLFSRPPPSFC